MYLPCLGVFHSFIHSFICCVLLVGLWLAGYVLSRDGVLVFQCADCSPGQIHSEDPGGTENRTHPVAPPAAPPSTRLFASRWTQRPLSLSESWGVPAFFNASLDLSSLMSDSSNDGENISGVLAAQMSPHI